MSLSGFKYLTKQGLHNLTRNKLMSIASIGVLTACLVITGVATGVAGVPATFSFLDFLPYNFHCWGLLIIFFLSIMTGVGRKRKKTV